LGKLGKLAQAFLNADRTTSWQDPGMFRNRETDMTCHHLQSLYELCRNSGIKLSSSDLIRVVCTECEIEEVCPAEIFEEDGPTRRLDNTKDDEDDQQSLQSS
jgi:hypothetical protein